MNPPDPWQHLLALARTSSPGAIPVSNPVDDARFAARVVARWAHPPQVSPTPVAFSFGLPWETWSLRGMTAAGALAVLMLAWNLPLLTRDNLPDDVLPPDPVAELAATF